MSIAEVKPYMRARMQALNWKEHKDPFNFANIPESILDKSFHVQLGTITQVQHNQYDLTIEVPCFVRGFLKGYKDVNTKYDVATSLANDIILEILKPSNRLSQAGGIKNIKLAQCELNSLDESNDNAIVIEQLYNVTVIICP